MTLEELKQIKESLEECRPNVEDFSWGPSLEFAERRKKEALRLLRKEIKIKRKENAES